MEINMSTRTRLDAFSVFELRNVGGAWATGLLTWHLKITWIIHIICGVNYYKMY